jgi:abortive infection bacteriophage resistance protein
MPIYDKPPLTLPEQIEHLSAKGLLIPDKLQALTVLRRVGLYRLKGYLLPYKTAQGYQPGLAFGDIERLMRLDDALRLHVLGAMQVVEVGVRQAMVQCLLERHGLRWYAEAALFNDSAYFDHASFLTSVTTEFHALPELFVGHYRERYDQEAPPPIWMIAETMSLGRWSKLFEALASQADRDAITAPLAVRASTFASWLHALTVVRNVCAHQSRLYDRTFNTMGLADDKRVRRSLLTHSLDPRDDQGRRVGARLYALHRLTQALGPGSSWTIDLKRLLAEYTPAELPHLGLRPGWDSHEEWASFKN